MKHRQYIRVTENTDSVVLMIHGIAGTPGHFAFLMPSVPERLSAYNILLDGHGGSVTDFSRTSMKKWKAQVGEVLESLLSRYDRVFIAAHSMGTLFAVQAAIDHPGRIAGLFLLSPPLRPRVKPSAMLTALRVGLGWFSPGDHSANAMYNDTSIRLTRKMWQYVGWMPRMIELLAECRRIRGALPMLQTSAQAFHARKDELVSLRSMKDMEGHPFIENTILENSGHFACSPEDEELLRRRLAGMIEALRL